MPKLFWEASDIFSIGSLKVSHCRPNFWVFAYKEFITQYHLRLSKPFQKNGFREVSHGIRASFDHRT
jgi:hypothetical protein